MVFARTLRRLDPRAKLVIGVGGAGVLALAGIGSGRLIAQIEGDRGIAPVASTTDIEVDGIAVDTTGKSGREARDAGYALARRLAWQKYGGAQLSDAQLDAMTSAIVVQREQIGPRRYIATLGVVFDRAKAGEFAAAASGASYVRSAPLLVIPLMISGGVGQVFEVRTAWQRAWANFQTGASSIDYVRPNGAGVDSLLLNAGQVGRRSRSWWRTVLDRYDASDVIVPVARIEREWPGGPIKGTFTARYGPDDTYLDSFTLTARDDGGLVAMLNEALVRIDLIYRDALARGDLRPDPSLTSESRTLAALIAQVRARLPTDPAGVGDAAIGGETSAPSTSASAAPAATVTNYSVQFATPDPAALDATIAAVRGAIGVRGATTTSLAIGGASVMRVGFAGDIEALATALRARGFQVSVANGGLTIRR